MIAFNKYSRFDYHVWYRSQIGEWFIIGKFDNEYFAKEYYNMKVTTNPLGIYKLMVRDKVIKST